MIFLRKNGIYLLLSVLRSKFELQMIQRLRVAFIGSINLHRKSGLEKDIKLCEQVCYRFAELGIVGVSSLCDQGIDAIMQRMYSRAVHDGVAFLSQIEVYVAKQTDIHRSRLPNKQLARVCNSSLKKTAEELASRYHHTWQYCNSDSRGIHSRNAQILFGYDLKHPVDAVITWCEVAPNMDPLGDTGVLIRMAWDAQIQVFNLHLPNQKETLHQIHNFLKRNNVHGVQ